MLLVRRRAIETTNSHPLAESVRDDEKKHCDNENLFDDIFLIKNGKTIIKKLSRNIAFIVNYVRH